MGQEVGSPGDGADQRDGHPDGDGGRQDGRGPACQEQAGRPDGCGDGGGGVRLRDVVDRGAEGDGSELEPL